MAKKKLAVFATGWSAQNLTEYLKGMQRTCMDMDADVFLFLPYPPSYEYADILHSELNIYKLPCLEDFDGLAVLSTTISYPEELGALINRCKESGVPVISHGVKFDGVCTSYVNNEIGMSDLCSHVFDVHNIKNPAFIAGSSRSEESEIRFSVFKEAMKDRGLTFNEKFFVHTEWDNLRAVEFVNKLKRECDDMPDAFICANDGLAMAVTVRLNELGFDVPKDILVTGFDFLFDSQIFYPCISSVNQQFYSLGAETAAVLLSAEGKPIESEGFSIPCKFIPGESCGCENARDSILVRRQAGRDAFTSRMRDNLVDRTLSIFEREVAEVHTFEELQNKFKELIYEKHILDSDSAHIILDASAFSEGNDITKAKHDGFSENNIVLLSMEDNVLSPASWVSRHSLIPNIGNVKGSHMYTFLPLYESDNVLGYMAVRDRMDFIYSRVLQKYSARLGIDLQIFRQNQNLTFINGQLAIQARRDALTNIQNRAAYEDDVIRYESIVKNQEDVPFAIAMFDINNLKEINDELGHDAGDEYIVSACRTICNTFANSLVYRLGGDEFLTILVGKDFDNRDSLFRGFRELMESYKDVKHLPRTKKVSIACGMAEYYPGSIETYSDIFKRADQLMYENKAFMKSSKPR